MVSLERIPDEEDIPEGIGDRQLFREMLRYDEWRLRKLIERHHHYTGSARARRDPGRTGRTTCRSSSRSCPPTTGARWSNDGRRTPRAWRAPATARREG